MKSELRVLRVVGLGLLLAGLGAAAEAQNAAVQGYCQSGGVKVVTQGMNSTTTVQGSYPKCMVTVFLTGTTTPATIYADAGGTPLTSEFTAKTDGSWIFWAPAGAVLDVVMQGGSPTPMPVPVNMTGVHVSGGGSGGGGTPLPPSSIVYGVTSSTARAATPADIGTLLGTLASCADPAKVYSPAAGACIASAGGSSTPAAPSFAVQLANSGATALAADPNILINTTTHALTAPSFNGTANNYPLLAGTTWSAYNFPCQQTALSGDPGGHFLGSNCITIPRDNNWGPGFVYGSPGTLSNTGGEGHNTVSIYPISSYQDGIQQGFGIYGTYNGGSDKQLFNNQIWAKPACIFGSDECVASARWVMAEEPEYTGTVTAGGGSAALTLTCTSNCSGIGLHGPLIDLTTAQPVTVTYGSGGSNTPTTVTVSLTVPVSITGTLAANVDAPRTVNNTTGRLSETVITTNLNVSGGVAVTTAQACTMMGPAFFETVHPTAVGALTGGVQSITAVFHYSHTAGATFYCGGAIGYIENTAYTSGGYRYVENVYGSLGPHTLLIGHQIPNGVAGSEFTSGISAGNYYQGAEVIGVINPASGTPDGGYLAVEGNAGVFANGDSVQNVNNISAGFLNQFFGAGAFGIHNPYATRVGELYSWNGLGGANGLNSGWKEFSNTNPASSYIGAGGVMSAPYLNHILGPTSGGIAWDRAPLYSGNTRIGQNCNGFLLCIANGIDPAATSTIEGLINPRSNGSSNTFNFDTASGLFNFTGGVTVGGVPIGTQISGLTAGYIPLASSASTLTSNSPLSYNVLQPNALVSARPLSIPLIGGPGYREQSLTLIGESLAGDAGEPYRTVGTFYGYSQAITANSGQIYFHGGGGAYVSNHPGLLIDGQTSTPPVHYGNVGISYTVGSIVPYPLSVQGASGFACTGGSCPAQIDASGNLTVVSCTGCGSGGGGSITGSGTTNSLAKFTGSTAIGNSSITDNGTTVAITEPVTVPSLITGTPSTGASAALPAGSHGVSCDETATPGVPAAGVDYLRCDATTHSIVRSFNGGAEVALGYTLGGTLSCSNVALQPGAGTGASCSAVNGTDGSHEITILTGTAPSGSSAFFIVTFTASRGHVSYCTVGPQFSEYTAVSQIPYDVFGSATSYTVTAGTALAASSPYHFNVSCP